MIVSVKLIGLEMKETTRSDYQSKILKVLHYLEQNVDRDIDITELAGVANYSIFHFHRIFKGVVGESVADYKRRLKLEDAATKLKGSGNSVTDLSLDAGFENVESFIRAFKKNFGITPLQFKKTFSLINEIPGKNQSENYYRNKLSELINQRGDIAVKFKIEKCQKRKVIAVRHVGPYKDCTVAWEKLCSFAGPRGLLEGDTKCLGLCYDDPEVTPAEKIRYDACLTIDKDIELADGIAIIEIPEGDYAITLHKGTYENLHQTYTALCGKVIEGSKKSIRNAPSIEVYLNNPQEVAPEELRTEVQMPVE